MVICEAALRCEWNHVGSLEALAACQLAIIRTEDVERVLSGRSLMQEVSLMYARTFHAALISCKPPTAEWPSDIKIPAGSYGEIVGSTGASLSIFLSVIAHSMLWATRTWTSRINFGELEQQVRPTGIPRIACSNCGPYRLRCHRRRPDLPRAERPPSALLCVGWAWL